MANNTKNRKPLTTQHKGVICLVVLLAVTILFSCFALFTRNSGEMGMYEHRSWVPVSSANWPKSLPVTRALGGGTSYEYSYTVSDDAPATAVEDSVNTIRNRLNQLGESDVAVSAAGGVLRIELRDMKPSSAASLLSTAIRAGQFTFTDSEGNQLLTEKEIKHANVEVVRQNANSTSFSVVMEFEATDEGAKALADAQDTTLTVTMDGETVASYATVDGRKVRAIIGYNNSAYNTAYNVAFWMNYGAVDVALNTGKTDTVKATSGAVLTVSLIAGLALLLGALVYLAMKGKLTGVAGFLAVWCSLVIALFLVATIVVPTVNVLNTGCLIAVLLGVLLAVDAAVTRTDAITAEVKNGTAVKQASKLGFAKVAKNVWALHGIVLAVALVLMIFSFSKSTGYCLACGVVGSAVGLLVMRAYQYCFNMITGKAAVYGGDK